MTRDEWIDRCANRYISASNIGRESAHEFAVACADQQAEVNGSSVTEWDSPETAADDDMSYWEGDE